MAILLDKLLSWKIPDVAQQLTQRDTILYALGVGVGFDPCDRDQLKFVHEQNLEALPTMAIVLGYPSAWYADPDSGVTYADTLHAEQELTLHDVLPVAGSLVGQSQVTDVIDKGVGRGAFFSTQTVVRDVTRGHSICSHSSTIFCRADGGFGGPTRAALRPDPIPARAADKVCDLETLPQAALLYRLSGDYNPLHADPAAAQRCGYPRPILHGRCTFAIAGHAILKSCCGYQTSRFKSMKCRFSAPVYPGETIRTEMWLDGDVVLFRASVPARGVTILNHGRAEIGSDGSR